MAWLLAGCGGGTGSGAAIGDSQGFVVAESHALTVNATAGGELKDNVAGFSYRFPDGGKGNLKATRLSGVPAAPSAGTGWRMEYSGTQPVELVLKGAFDGSADWPVVYAYDRLTTSAIDDDKGNGPRWVTVPVRLLSSGRYTFELNAEAVDTPSSSSREQPQAAPVKPLARDYWISTIKADSSDVDKRVARGLQAATYSDLVAATAPADVAKTFTANRGRRILSWGDDGNYYTGFFTFTDLIRRFSPRLTVSLDMNSLAHELSHYHTHLLVGDDVYATLESKAWWNYPRLHVINTMVNRATINEEYAFVLEQFLVGHVGSYTLFEPGVYLINRPVGDVPSIEGFGAAMLASLVRPTTSILGIDNLGKTVTVPVVGKTWSQLIGIIAAGKTDINSLRRQIDSTLDADGRSRFQVNLQRLGWRYSATLRAVDNAGQPVANADARVLVRNGGGEFVSDIGKTDADGRLNLWFAFPGTATLEVQRSGETLEGQITIDPDRPTTDRIPLGDVLVTPLQRFQGLQEVCASFTYTSITAESKWEKGPFSVIHCVTPSPSRPLLWSGSMFYVQDGTTYIEGIYMQSYAQVQNLKARRPLNGSYRVTPPLFEIIATDLQRDLASPVVRFRLQGAAAAGRYTINYQPEDDCSFGYCEKNLVKSIDPASVVITVTFRDY